MFPVLQWRYRDDVYLSEIVPQLAYGGEGKNIIIKKSYFPKKATQKNMYAEKDLKRDLI